MEGMGAAARLAMFGLVLLASPEAGAVGVKLTLKTGAKAHGWVLAPTRPFVDPRPACRRVASPVDAPRCGHCNRASKDPGPRRHPRPAQKRR